jgi:diguanylate cyclase (GGDEF)-like protein
MDVPSGIPDHRQRAVVSAGELAHPVPALTESALCEEAREAFELNPGLFALPVVDRAGRPVGLVNRFTFLERFAARFGRELTAKKPVSALMETDPLILDADTNIDELGSRLLAQQHRYVLDGFIVVIDGRYVGAGTGLDLIRALTDRRHAELQRLADHDVLTGLPNRAVFDRHLAATFSSRGDHQRWAVLFMDLDRFKQVNDTYGHRVGDLVLCAVAERLRATVRGSDMVARLSGDEFGFVLSEIGTAGDAENIARVLLATCAAPLSIDAHQIVISCSIGLAIYPEDAATPEELLRAADMAHYYAKDARNSWQRYATEMVEWHGPMPAVGSLRQAIETGRIHLHYQPIIALETGRVTGVEALVRWNDSEIGAVPADAIVRLAEDSGLIVTLGEYVVRAAIAQMHAWDRATGRTDLRLAVNVSPVQIHQGGLIPMLDRALAESGFDPRRIDLELTERAAMRGVSALPTLHAIKARGLALTLDDFGSGYSSLSRLAHLPIDAIKIDKSFLERIGEPHGEVITRAIIAMARTLGLRIVAEGVETREQLAFLKSERCSSVQGFLLSRPVSAETLAPLLTCAFSTATDGEP